MNKMDRDFNKDLQESDEDDQIGETNQNDTDV
jgi:hypothetical protein